MTWMAISRRRFAAMFPRLLCFIALFSVSALAQQVTLPLPRLLTTMPMGGQAGQSVEVTITGENIEDVTELTFSTPKITAKPTKKNMTHLQFTMHHTPMHQPNHHWNNRSSRLPRIATGKPR